MRCDAFLEFVLSVNSPAQIFHSRKQTNSLLRQHEHSPGMEGANSKLHSAYNILKKMLIRSTKVLSKLQLLHEQVVMFFF